MSMWSQTWSYWQAGGFLLLPMAMICFGILLVGIRTSLLFKARYREGLSVRMLLESMPQQATVPELRARLPQTGFAVVLHAALDDIEMGHPPMDAFRGQTETAVGYMRRDLIILAALTASAPLLGLLGTVGGMIHTFEAVASVSGNTGSRVAAGISRALITTQFGLVVAMPGVFGYVRLQRLLRNLEVLLGACRAHAVALIEASLMRQERKAS